MNRRQYLKNCILFGASYLLSGRGVLANNRETQSVESRQLRLRVALKNVSNTKLKNPFLWLVVPANTGRQKLLKVDASADFVLEPDVLGQNILKFKLQDIGPFSTKLINITAEVAWLDKSKNPILASDMWLKSERLIESSHPKITLLASQLKRENDAQTSAEIYQWVSERIQYAGYISDNLGALYALENLKGDCTEYACLAAALARANGIPARVVGGYFLNSGRIVKARDYHHWAEVYFNGAWHLLDAQKRNWLAPHFSYISYNYYQTSEPSKIGLSKRYKVSPKLNVAY